MIKFDLKILVNTKVDFKLNNICVTMSDEPLKRKKLHSPKVVVIAITPHDCTVDIDHMDPDNSETQTVTMKRNYGVGAAVTASANPNASLNASTGLKCTQTMTSDWKLTRTSWTNTTGGSWSHEVSSVKKSLTIFKHNQHHLSWKIIDMGEKEFYPFSIKVQHLLDCPRTLRDLYGILKPWQKLHELKLEFSNLPQSSQSFDYLRVDTMEYQGGILKVLQSLSNTKNVD